MRFDNGIPLAMKVMADNVEGLELSVGEGETGRIGLAVPDGSDVQTLLGGRMRNQFNDGFQRREWFDPPIHGNEGKEAMFDLVLLARRRGIMRGQDRELFFIGKGLQGIFPPTPNLPAPPLRSGSLPREFFDSSPHGFPIGSRLFVYLADASIADLERFCPQIQAPLLFIQLVTSLLSIEFYAS